MPSAWKSGVREIFCTHTFSPVSNVKSTGKIPGVAHPTGSNVHERGLGMSLTGSRVQEGGTRQSRPRGCQILRCLVLRPLKSPHTQRWVHLECSRRGQTKGLLVVPGPCVKTTKRWNFTNTKYRVCSRVKASLPSTHSAKRGVMWVSTDLHCTYPHITPTSKC